MTRKVAQNTRPTFSHVREGLGMRLILGVDLTDTWYRFALWLPGLHPGSPTTHSFLLSFSYLQCLSVHVSRAVPEFFLVVEQPLLHPKYTTIQHTQLFPPQILLHAFLPLALEKANHGAQIFALEPALCLCWSKSWLSKAIQCPNPP